MLGLVYFCIQMGVYAINFWLPSIIKSLGYESAQTVGWLSAIPYLFAAVFMVWAGRSADKHRERRWHVSAPMLMGLFGLLMAANFSSNPLIVMIGLSMATMGALAALSMFWSLPAAFLRQEDHAHAVFARRRQFHALLGHFFAVVLVGNLDQDAGDRKSVV